MYNDVKNIGVLRKLPMQGVNKVQCRIPVIYGQRTAHADHSNLFLGRGIDLAGDGAFESRNRLAAVSLLSEAEGLLRSQCRLRCGGAFCLLAESGRCGPQSAS